MLAAMFSFYGNQTRLDRLNTGFNSLVRKAARRYACMHTCGCGDRRCRIYRLSLYVSFQLCRVCFLRGLAFSQQLSAIPKVDNKGLKYSRKFAYFSGVGGGLADLFFDGFGFFFQLSIMIDS